MGGKVNKGIRSTNSAGNEVNGRQRGRRKTNLVKGATKTPAKKKESKSKRDVETSRPETVPVKRRGRPPKNDQSKLQAQKGKAAEKQGKVAEKSVRSPRKADKSPEKKVPEKKSQASHEKRSPNKRSPKKEVNGEEKFQCATCPRSFCTMGGLRRHNNKCKEIEVKQEEQPTDIEIVPISDLPLAISENGETLNCFCCGEDLASCHTEGNFECSDCGKRFRLESSLIRHKQTMHREEEYFNQPTNSTIVENLNVINLQNLDTDYIDEADEVEISMSELQEMNGKTSIDCFCCGEDLLTAHTTGDLVCDLCKKRFSEKIFLERHMIVVHGAGDGSSPGSHECPQCGAKCPDKGTLARHMYTHTGLKPYSCPVCKQEFSRKYHLVRHNMQTGCDGSKKPIFPCQVCGREFNRKDNLREHLRAHAGQTKRKKMFACDTCGMEFFGTNLLLVHKRSHTGEKPYWCEFCPKRFPSSGALKKHRRTHTGERPYECSVCFKRFGAKETLNRHMRIHTGYKPHCCQYCGKRFIQSSQLKSHLFYHTGQSVLQPSEPIECDICGKKFNRRARLNEHTKYVHLGAKPFECNTCGKTFIRKEDLNRHLIIHSGVKAHKCPICEKAFAMKSSLKVHLLTHTKEQPRSCDECGRAFIRQDCLLRHMRNKHRDMLEKIMSETEKKKLQQQLLQMAAEANQLEGLESRRELEEEALNESVKELLGLLVDETTLQGLGYPQASVYQLLESVIRRCGHDPAPIIPGIPPTPEQLRHNVKLLFTVVIDDSAVKALLNNQTVDEVILHVLRLAKS